MLKACWRCAIEDDRSKSKQEEKASLFVRRELPTALTVLLSWKTNPYCLVSRMFKSRSFPRATRRISHSLANDSSSEVFAFRTPNFGVLVQAATPHPLLQCHV